MVLRLHRHRGLVVIRGKDFEIIVITRTSKAHSY